MSEPRVLMTADAVGGVWTYAMDVARGLSARGVEVSLAILGPAPGADQRTSAPAAGVKLIETGLPLDWTAEGPEPLAQAARRLAELARDHGADVVHLNSPALAALADFPAPVIGGCHSCLATWWAAVRGGPMPEDFRWRAELTGRGYRACDLLVAPTHAFARATADAYALKAPPRVVHNGRAPVAADAVDAPDRFVFTAGRLWDEGKGLRTLNEAAARVDAPVIAAGPVQGPSGQTVPLDRLRLLGALPEAEVAGWMAAAPVFASAALYEPFGLAVLEAAQAGCALVLSDISGFRELWDGAAVFASPHDPEAFAGAMQQLLDGGAERTRLAEAARRRAATYTSGAMTEGVLALYREVLARPREAAA